LFFIKLDTREVHIAGITANPNESWMNQMARNLTMEEWGILKPGQYLIHDGDKKFCASFKEMLDHSGVKRVPLPPRSPWLNSFAERWVQAVKTEALSQMILFGERSLRHVLGEYVTHFREERPHQGKGNVILSPRSQENQALTRPLSAENGLVGCFNTTTVRPHEYFDGTGGFRTRWATPWARCISLAVDIIRALRTIAKITAYICPSVGRATVPAMAA
jgi:hypothetical protein